ncbi:MAG: AAA family ATPase [Thermoplasmatota archaeon]
MTKGKRLTVGEKIQILLLDYTRFKGEMQAPIDVTQDGIANNLGIIRSAVPRAVGSLIDRGLVEEHLAHIGGLTRRRKVYMLTDEGIMVSRSILEELGTQVIEVRGEDEVRKESLVNLLQSKEVTLKNISEVTKNGMLDKNKKVVKEKRREKAQYAHTLSPPDIFIGREREIAEIKEAIESNKRRITVVYGIAGVGKTTLAWKITQDFSSTMNIFYIDLKEWTTIAYVLKELGNFLASAGWDSLKTYMDLGRETDIENTCDLLREIPDSIPLILVFDDLHRAPQDVIMFLQSFKQRIGTRRRINLIVLSRFRAEFYDIRDVRINNLVGEIELLGFDRKTSRQFLIERGFPESEVDEIIERTGGHPLALVLVEKEGMGIDVSDFNNFLTAEIFSKLTAEEARVLGLISLCRLQLSEDDIEEDQRVPLEILKKMCDMHLLFKTPGGYVLHDLVKEHAVNNLSATDLEKAHRDLAEIFHEKLINYGFYQDLRGDVPPTPFSLEDERGLGPVPLYVAEEMHHLLGCGSADRAVELMVRSALMIPSKDLIVEMGKDLISEMPTGKGDRSRIYDGSVTILKDVSDNEYLRGLNKLKETVKFKAGDDLASSMISALRIWYPWLEEKVNGPEKALKVLDKMDPDEIPKKLAYYFQVFRASLLYKLGDHRGASRSYRAFLDRILGSEDLPIQLREVTENALREAEEGNIHHATDNFQKIMELIQSNREALREEMPFVDMDHHILSAIYSVYYGRSVK